MRKKLHVFLMRRAPIAALALLSVGPGCGSDDVIKPATLSSSADAPVQDSGLDGTGGPGDASEDDGLSTSDALWADGATDDGGMGDSGPADDGTTTQADTDDASGDDAAGDTALASDVPPAQCPGDPTCACKAAGDCNSGICLESPAGLVCAAPCVADQPCAPGTGCVTLPGADTTTTDDDLTVCAPKWPTWCDPCELSAACTATGSPKAACVGWGGAPGSDGWFCATPCKSDDQCPAGAVCGEATEKAGEAGSFCVPSTGTCSCSPAATAKAASTSCSSEVTLPSGITATCLGARVCGASGLSTCGAQAPTAEVCDGLDNDCNGQTDDGATCNDTNPCTSDVCEGGQCAAKAATGPCDDGSACTQSDACLDGSCAGAPLSCDDGNSCTDDSCDKKLGCVHAPQTGAACDDGIACTGGDSCANGTCKSGEENLCPCQSDADCAPGNDDNLCNGTLYCAKSKAPFVCVINPSTVVVCDPKDDSACAANLCDAKSGTCALTPQAGGLACDDGTLCTTGDVCTAGTCAGATKNCDDGNTCSADSCDPKVGCGHKPITGPCSDGDPCSVEDTCVLGACTPVAKTCDDGYACTDDACDPATGACQNNQLADPTCGVVTLPWTTDLACEATLAMAQWQRSDWMWATDDVRWGFDATPTLPKAQGCSLNINNGKDLSCKGTQSSLDASVLSPWIDATAVPAGHPLAVRLDIAGSWTAQHTGWVFARIAGGEWIELGQAPTPTSSEWNSLQFPILGMSGKLLQLRLRFAGPCTSGQVGWFVDNLAVFEDLCGAGSTACPANNICTTDAAAKVVCTPCPAGLELKANKCTDIDECAKPGTCDANAGCSNSAGSYACTCNAGFTGNGKICSDIDECATGAAGCLSTAVCVNKPGTFACSCAANLVPLGKGCATKGSSAQAPAVSCLEILTLYPTSADAAYWLDVDGSGGVAPAQYYCDMKGGGWTLLIFDDFENGSPSGWSAGSVQKCGDFGSILGGADQFGSGAATSKTVAAPAHTQAKLSLTYLRLDSWDSETAVVQVNGNNVWTKKGSGGLNAFANQCGKWAWSDESWGASWSGAHTAASATVTATSTLNQGAGDEAFGIDNVALWVK